MKLFQTLMALVILALSSWGQAATMSESEFTQYFIERAKTTLPDLHFKVVQPLQLSFTDQSGAQATTFLTNAYHQYVSAPDHLADILNSQLQSIKSRPQQLAAMPKTSIFAILKPADYLVTVRNQLAQANAGKKELPLIYEKLNDDILIVYVFDTENGMRMITKKDLDDAKLDVKSLRALAAQNMTSYFDKKGVKVQLLEKVGNAKIYMVQLDESYEASILLLQKYWTKKTFDVAGEIVAYVPARNVVFVTGSEDKEGMRLAAFISSKAYNEMGYAISQKGFSYSGGTWKLIGQ